MMSDEEEDYDELPPITVHSSGRDSSVFCMPCASEVAAQRARELHCEEELRKLHTDQEHISRAVHSDSSSSEGEAGLAARVATLDVGPAGAPPRATRGGLLRALAPRLPPAARALLDHYLRAAAACDERARAALDRRVSGEVCAVVAGGGGAPLGDAEAAWCGAWLCAAAAGDVPPSVPQRRALHLLLDDVATEHQVVTLRAAVTGAGPESARVELSDALRSGGPRAAELAAAVAGSVLDALLPTCAGTDEGTDAEVSAWRRLSARARYVCLQAGARAAPSRAAALAAAPPPDKDHHPDSLKVLVAASKLQMLFNINK